MPSERIVLPAMVTDCGAGHGNAHQQSPRALARGIDVAQMVVLDRQRAGIGVVGGDDAAAAVLDDVELHDQLAHRRADDDARTAEAVDLVGQHLALVRRRSCPARSPGRSQSTCRSAAVAVLTSLFSPIQAPSTAQRMPLPAIEKLLRAIAIEEPARPRPVALIATCAQAIASLPVMRVLRRCRTLPSRPIACWAHHNTLSSIASAAASQERRLVVAFGARRGGIVGQDADRSEYGVLGDRRAGHDPLQGDRRAAVVGAAEHRHHELAQHQAQRRLDADRGLAAQATGSPCSRCPRQGSCG